MKKLVTILLGVLMFVSLMQFSIKADNIAPINPKNNGLYLIEIDQKDCHFDSQGNGFEYKALRIFKGVPSEIEATEAGKEPTKILSDIEWDTEFVDVDGLKQDLVNTFPKQFSTALLTNGSAADFADGMSKVTRKELLTVVISRHLKRDNSITIYHLHRFTNPDHADWEIYADSLTKIIDWELSKTPGFTHRDTDINLSDLGGTWTRGEHKGYRRYVEPGYYFIANDVVPSDAAGTSYILEIAGNLKIEPKSLSAPRFDKQVATMNDSLSTQFKVFTKNDENVTFSDVMSAVEGWSATADYDIGDDVTYRLSITMPDANTLTGISHYRIEVYDDMSQGLTLNEDSILMFYGYSEESDYSHYTRLSNNQIVSKEYYQTVRNNPIVIQNDATKAEEFFKEMMNVYPEYYKKESGKYLYLDCEQDGDHVHNYGLGSTCTFKEFVPGTTKITTDSDVTEHTANRRSMTHDYIETHVWYEVEPSAKYTNGTALSFGCDSINHLVSKVGELNEGIHAHLHIVYSAKLNGSARVGVVDQTNKADGNPNIAYLKYSQSETLFEGKTPEYKNEVYTYQLTIKKQDGNGNELKGADFQLLKFYKEIKSAKEGLKYYVSDQNKKHPAIDAELKEVTSAQVGSTIGNVWVVVDPKEANANLDKEQFDYVGIDNGIYLLTELKAPTGYNKINGSVEFEIKTTHTSNTTDPQFESITVKKISGPIEFETGKGVTSLLDAKLEATVVNKQGVQLPSTGGMGTTIFYIGGAALIVAAATLLIAKKRKISD